MPASPNDSTASLSNEDASPPLNSSSSSQKRSYQSMISALSLSQHQAAAEEDEASSPTHTTSNNAMDQSILSNSTTTQEETTTKKKRKTKASSSTASTKSNKNCRDDSSLRLLTRKFIHLIAEAKDGVLDLNHAAETLSVQKRRIYDITNVLEGIGLIEKKSKNNIQWLGTGIAVNAPENCEEVKIIQNEIATIEFQERQVDQLIYHVQESLRCLNETDRRLAFVTYDDVLDIPTLKDRTVIAIKAPSGTTLTVPDPDEGMELGKRRYQIFLKSPADPIDVYLVDREENVVSGGGAGGGGASEGEMGTTAVATAVHASLPFEHGASLIDDSNIRGVGAAGGSVGIVGTGSVHQQSNDDFMFEMDSGEGVSDLFL
ncbi:hypothetical protein C9374_000865 [Naegleria lovaniensis]|uniref:E2F/DP family winged-helix DNA-binding domain-containing protein n=1 Tax=Naegleria lovaniensis TaxID=51637 RepID=A0AA88KLM1_NAELO|nr:uncharacterized protein C9374_000865 [Naegleria lovaniensis]KAG2388015.1 hypothetical protein C9374_000865 [Naegleria lovaniensis]